MDRILLVDKPPNLTSFDVIRKLRKILGVRKMGHAGTLDPLATGLLIIGIGKKTKELSSYLKLDKVYEVELTLGKESDTYDARGHVRDVYFSDLIPQEKITSLLKTLLGPQKQIPPAFSAVKVSGRKSYELARKGISVSLPPRKIVIKELYLLYYDWPVLKLRISCSSGTYIRSFAHDLGKRLRCGAIVSKLRRTKIGEFSIDEAILIEDALSFRSA